MTNSFITDRDTFARAMPEQRTTINGREWGSIRVGNNGPALILLPGTLGRGDIFWNQITTLKDRTQILALTYPDEGSMEDWTKDICLLMDEVSFDAATILGSSLGGYIAQYFAATQHERVQNLIAANTLSAVDFLSNVPPYSHDLNETTGDTLLQEFVDNLSKAQQEVPAQNLLVEFLLAEVKGNIPPKALRQRLKVLKYAPAIPPQPLSSNHIYTVESVDDQLIPLPIRDAVRASLKPARAFRFVEGSHFPYILRHHAYTAMLEEVLGLQVSQNRWDDGDLVEQ